MPLLTYSIAAAGAALFTLGAWSSRPHMSWQDYLRGTYILGLPGMGKTTAIINDVYHHILRGRGVIYIDMADSCRKLLNVIPTTTSCPPPEIVYVAPWRKGPKVGFNLLRRYTWDEQERNRLAGSVVQTFATIFPRSWGDVIEHCLKMALLAVLEATEGIQQQVTLLDIHRFMTEESYRDWVIKNVHNPIVRQRVEAQQWDGKPGSSPESVDRKLADLLCHSSLVALFSHPNGLDLRECMDECRVVLFDLDTANLDPYTSVFAAALALTAVQCAAYSRKQDVSPGCVLYLDEFHRYANDSIEELLTQARKYCLATVLAHQTGAGQLTGRLAKAVHVASTQIYYRCMLEDAKYAAERCGERRTGVSWYDINNSIDNFIEGLLGHRTKSDRKTTQDKWEAADFVNLPAYVCIRSRSINNTITPAERVRCPRPDDEGHVDELIDRSLKDYATPLGTMQPIKQPQTAAVFGGRRAPGGYRP